MPIAAHHLDQRYLEQPDDDAILWRFMDLPGFLALIQNEAFAFGRASDMNDPMEGGYSDPLPEEVELEEGSTRPLQFGDKTKKQEYGDDTRKLVNMSCWYVSPGESFSMWEVYQRLGTGVGIRTTWGKLKTLIDPDNKHEAILGGLVVYTDYVADAVRFRSIHRPFFYKRMAFASEQEARLVIIGAKMSGTHTPDEHGNYNDVREVAPDALLVDINLKELVDQVVIAPATRSWVRTAVQKGMEDAGYDWTVKPSSLDTPLSRE